MAGSTDVSPLAQSYSFHYRLSRSDTGILNQKAVMNFSLSATHKSFDYKKKTTLELFPDKLLHRPTVGGLPQL
jgi:hypothetical protein